jgi:hypothetical protein
MSDTDRSAKDTSVKDIQTQEIGAGEPDKKKWPDCCLDCTHNWQSKDLTPDSNELLNIFLMVLGGFTILYGLFQQFPDLFPWLTGLASNPDFQTFVGVLGGMHIILGGFALIAGIGMFREQEWAWGMSLMVLTFIIANTIMTIISTPFDWANIGFWLQLLSLGFAIIGIPWLLATKARYT